MKIEINASELLRDIMRDSGWTQEQVAAKVGASQSSINRWLAGNSKPNGSKLDKILRLHSEVSRRKIIDTAKNFHKISAKRYEPDEKLNREHGDWIQFAGHAQAGQWFEVDIHTNGEKRTVPIQPDPRYRRARQYAWRVEGDSMDRAGILPGMFALGVDYGDYIDQYGEIVAGDLVVVERSRFSGQEREITIKRYWPEDGRVLLYPDSNNPIHKAIEIPDNAVILDPAGDPMEIQIKAVVIASINILTREKMRQISDFE